jgi:hypothetical protein
MSATIPTSIAILRICFLRSRVVGLGGERPSYAPFAPFAPCKGTLAEAPLGTLPLKE